MQAFLVIFLILILAGAAISLVIPAAEVKWLYFINTVKSVFSIRPRRAWQRSRCRSGLSCPAVVTGFHSRVQQKTERKQEQAFDFFSVEICGLIKPPADTEHVEVRIELTDITQPDKAMPVHTSVKTGKRGFRENEQAENSPRAAANKGCGHCFVYFAELGRVPGANITLSDWTPIAKIESGWLIFPRRGNRNLRLDTTVVSKETGREFTSSESVFDYENKKLGYLDMQEGIGRGKTLAVALAFAVSVVDGEIEQCEVQVIREWAERNVESGAYAQKGARKLEKALEKTIEFFRDGNQVDIWQICDEIRQRTPGALHYEIIELCMTVARASGMVSKSQMTLLEKLAERLGVDEDKFYSMRERLLPAGILECKDTRTILGVTCDMDQEQARKRLNEEYKKWSARVTSSDPAVKIQADQMLEIIAETRSEYLV